MMIIIITMYHTVCQHGGVWGALLTAGCDGERSTQMSRKYTASQEQVRRRLHHDSAHAQWRHQPWRHDHQTVHNTTTRERKIQGQFFLFLNLRNFLDITSILAVWINRW